jgi:hypothetical protein
MTLIQTKQSERPLGVSLCCYVFDIVFLHFLFSFPSCVVLITDEVVERLPPTGPSECRRRVATTTNLSNDIRHREERMLALASIQNASATPLNISTDGTTFSKTKKATIFSLFFFFYQVTYSFITWLNESTRLMALFACLTFSVRDNLETQMLKKKRVTRHFSSCKNISSEYPFFGLVRCEIQILENKKLTGLKEKKKKFSRWSRYKHITRVIAGGFDYNPLGQRSINPLQPE